MKTKLLLSALLSFYFCLLSSQVPQGFNYQAIARNENGVISQDWVGIRVTIQTVTGSVIYQETNTVKTDNFGVMELVIGTGTPTSGTFSTIEWGAQTLYLKTEIAYPVSSGYVDMGTSQLWSVPYSMVAGDLNGSLDQLEVDGKSADNDPALFEVKNTAGNTVFAVYNEAVRMYVDNGSKGAKGGFAIGGFGTSGKDNPPPTGQDYLVVNPGIINMYIDDTQEKGAKGGFSIGGFGTGKGLNYLNVDQDKINAGKNEYMQFSDNNIFIGYQAGNANPVIDSTYNTFIGYQAGYNSKITTPSYNLFIGYKAGYTNTIGTDNVFLGYGAGYLASGNLNYNVFIGYNSGLNTTSSNNIFIGYNSGSANLGGNTNVFIGTSAGNANTSGYQNMFLAAEAGNSNIDGNLNTYLGYEAGKVNQHGSNELCIGAQAGVANKASNNVFIGFQSGASNLTGSGNLFIGYLSGYYETGSNKLFIDNQKRASEADARTKALVYGVFDATVANQRFTINAVLQLPLLTTDPTPAVEGMIYAKTDHHLYYYNGTIWTSLN